MIKNFRRLTSIGVVLAAASMNLGCDEIAEACDLECSAMGIADGNASISGVASIDAFFSSVVGFDAKASAIASTVDAELGRIALSLGLKGNASVDDITAELDAKFKANLKGGITVKAEPVRCEASIDATLEATARCDANFKPGKAEVKCNGTCEASASASAECSGEAELTCRGTAPGLECSGTCTGTCEVEAGAKCEGECKGTCEVDLEVAAACSGTCKGTCEVELEAGATCDGECSVELGADGSCAGTCTTEMKAGATCEGKCEGSCDAKIEGGATCEGTCTGSCELKAGATCEGSCKGECAYTPPSGECEANAKVECKAMADASVACEGSCDGTIEPPSASPECEASVEADAKVNVECKPPSLEIGYEFKAGVDAEAKAEFEAFITVFADSYANILAQGKRLEIVLEAGGDLVASAGGAVEGAIDTSLSGDLTLKSAAGLRCALTELGSVKGVVSGATKKLEGSLSKTVAITGAVQG